MKHFTRRVVLVMVAMSAVGISALGPATNARPVVRHAPAVPVVAETPAAPAPVGAPASRYDSAPWWSASHVIAQTGTAFVELPANRADFSANFRGVGKDVQHAQADAVTQAQGLLAALAKYDARQARVTTALQMRALYEQYRDSDGNKVDDERGDKINGYEVTITLSVDVRDMTQLEKIFAQMQAASPTAATNIAFTLQPDHAAITKLAGDAIRDAHVRALAAADATGGQLGAIRLVDPTGRACHGDLLAPGLPAAPVASAGADFSFGLSGYNVAGFADKNIAGALQRIHGNDQAPPPSPEDVLNAKALADAFIQNPPMQTLTAAACVVYDLL